MGSSSFSSWDDSSDFYWKKKSVKETDAVGKTTGYADRYEDDGVVTRDWGTSLGR